MANQTFCNSTDVKKINITFIYITFIYITVLLEDFLKILSIVSLIFMD